MDLTPYVSELQRQLAEAAAAGGEEARAVAERLSAPLDAAARLMLLDALSAAAGEIAAELAPGSVDLRLRAGEPEFVVVAPPDTTTEELTAGEPLPAQSSEDAATARINLRLPENLKARAEAAAAAGGLSVNSWLVRAVAAAVERGDQPTPRRSPSGGGRYTGWVN
jgi:antitoxin component of RelBE/YafQ-DinJ toxin-antitoxin module